MVSLWGKNNNDASVCGGQPCDHGGCELDCAERKFVLVIEVYRLMFVDSCGYIESEYVVFKLAVLAGVGS